MFLVLDSANRNPTRADFPWNDTPRGRACCNKTHLTPLESVQCVLYCNNVGYYRGNAIALVTGSLRRIRLPTKTCVLTSHDICLSDAMSGGSVITMCVLFDAETFVERYGRERCGITPSAARNWTPT